MKACSTPIPSQNAGDKPSDDGERGGGSTSGTSWHQLPGSEVIRRLGSDAGLGLGNAEAQARISRFGPNELPETEARGIGRILWEQISATMVVILLAAGLISLALGDRKDAIVIFAIVVLNAGFGLAQEYRAEKALQALRRLAAPAVKVRRDGAVEMCPAKQLVPGDIILLETGDIVGADGRLLEAVNLQMSEASLTGESVPVVKTEAPLPPEATLLHDRKNMVYLGTSVSIGRGTAVVVETGHRTQLGRIAELLGRADHELTPLQKRLAELARGLTAVIFVLVAAIFGLGLLRGEPAASMFLTAVSMAVAAVPEGLPAVVTIALALGAQRMLRRRALLRRLPAAETLGSVTVICSDKTGTLTENRMGVTSLETAGHAIENPGEDLASPFSSVALLLAAGALCNDARLEKRGAGPQTPLGDPMEIALATAARRARMDKGELDAAFSRVAEIPFDSARKRMTTVHRVPANLPAGLRDRTLPLASGGLIAFTKGALESILEVCDRQRVEAGEGPLDSAARTAIRLAGERWAQTGRRVLGFAYRQVLSGENLVSDEHRLVFLGLMGLSDPTRAEAKSAVQSCRTAGIRPVMITGDHPFTAQHVARELGIEGPVLCGAELEAMPDERLEALVDQIGIYARVLPEHKLRIVRALQARGHVVSMTGDGVNDAPALRQADIGVAMGITGTDVTKQVSDMVLLDDNFATVVAAVEEGRAIYDNIRKFIRYVLAGNFGELLVMLLGPFFGLSLPLLPVQILWINLVSDGLNGLALSVEPPERDTMNRPPRRAGESIFAGGMVRHIVGVGALLGLISLAVGLFFWHRHHPAWQAAIFLTLASGQAFQTLAARSWRDSIFRLGFKSNPMTLVSVALAVASTLAIVYVPALQNLFGTVSLSIGQLLAILAVSTVPFWSIEYGKYLLRRRG